MASPSSDMRRRLAGCRESSSICAGLSNGEEGDIWLVK